jgi:hypothetical protein
MIRSSNRGLRVGLAATLAFATPSTAQVALDSAPVTTRVLRGASWETVRGRHADLYAIRGSALQKKLTPLETTAHNAITGNLALLGAAAPTARLRLFFVSSRAELKTLLGATAGGHAETAEGAAFFVTNDSVGAPLRHETMHLLSWSLWGRPSSNWISEGLATLATKTCAGHDIDDIAASLDAERRLPSMATLRRDFTVAGEVGATHYIAAASLTSHIVRSRGMAGLKALWQQGGLANARTALGIEANTLEREWRTALERRARVAPWPRIYAAIRSHGCE